MPIKLNIPMPQLRLSITFITLNFGNHIMKSTVMLLKKLSLTYSLKNMKIYVKKQIDRINTYISNVTIINYESFDYKILNNLSVLEISYKDSDIRSEKIKNIVNPKDWIEKDFFNTIAYLCEIILGNYINLKNKLLESIENNPLTIEKARFDLTVYEIIVLFRLLKEEGIVTNNVTSVCNFLAESIVSKNKKNGLSSTSLLKKWYDLRI